MESTDSTSGSQHPHLPPGFRFHPTDEELVVHYLKKKIASVPLPVTIITEIDLYKFDPWELPSKATFGEQEWYFFSPRDRKYPNGARPNRAATSGYWKATGTDKPVLTSNGNQKVGVKKALVFYGGKPPKGIKTNWIMHEYRLVGNNSSTKIPATSGTKKASLRLDDWVLCRIYKKNNSQRILERERDDLIDDMLEKLPTTSSMDGNQINQKFEASNYGVLLENDGNFFDGVLNGSGIQSSSISNLETSNSKTDMSMGSTQIMKRMVQSDQYWINGTESDGLLLSRKRFQSDQIINVNSGSNGNGSFVSNFLNQIPQSASLNPNALLESLGDGVLRSGMNWNSYIGSSSPI